MGHIAKGEIPTSLKWRCGMQHWLEKLTDLAAIQGDECILNNGLADLAEHFGFTGYAYLHIQHSMSSR
nr:hypothetical protein K4M19_00024 [Agrobacterium fabrum]